MNKVNFNLLDDKEEEIADILISMGLSRSVARILTYLQTVDKATSIELERATGLSQPDVSIAMRKLKPHDWIDMREEMKTVKGRPHYVFSLKVGFNEIIAHLEKEQKKAVVEERVKFERLKKMG